MKFSSKIKIKKLNSKLKEEKKRKKKNRATSSTVPFSLNGI